MKTKATKATQNDVQEIDEVILNTWLNTYPDMLSVSRKDIVSFLGTKKKRIQGIQSGLNNKNVIIITARVHAHVAGVCFGYVKDAQSVIKGLYVIPQYQGKGIGTQLLKEFERKAYLPIELHVLGKNASAQRFYASQGYVDTGKYRYLNITGKRFRDNLYVKMK